ncbi:carboxylating nicotinate-nucleotide diphosphorylase [soil metagenome]
MSDFPAVHERIRLALVEDLSTSGDVTTDAVFAADAQGTAYVVAKEPGIICGGYIFAQVFATLAYMMHCEDYYPDPCVHIERLKRDGARVQPGDRVMNLRGPVRQLLAGERTALNFIQHLSGVATLVSKFVEVTAGRVKICDTRKTTPLWRDLEKYAVACGGGLNHRRGLYDMIMLKDTHADGAGSLAEALNRVEPLRAKFKVAAEARNLDEVRAAIAANVNLLMLDNMDRETLKQAVALVGGLIPTEITGGVNLATAAELSTLGVTRLSIGALTHSVKALDFSMKLEMGNRE